MVSYPENSIDPLKRVRGQTLGRMEPHPTHIKLCWVPPRIEFMTNNKHQFVPSFPFTWWLLFMISVQVRFTHKYYQEPLGITLDSFHPLISLFLNFVKQRIFSKNYFFIGICHFRTWMISEVSFMDLASSFLNMGLLVIGPHWGPMSTLPRMTPLK